MKYPGLINVTKRIFIATSIWVLITTLSLPAMSGAPRVRKVKNATQKRVITVSLLNDQNAPAPKDLILDLFSAVAAEYEEMVNIELKAIEYVPYSGDLTLHPMDQAFLLGRLSTRGEIRIIFSNATGRNESDLIADREAKDHLAGASHPYYGHIIIYDVEGRATKRDRAGNPALLTVIKHEIAHLFGAAHSKDVDSFMSTPSCRSFGRWTEEVIRHIDGHRRKKWFPNC